MAVMRVFLVVVGLLFTLCIEVHASDDVNDVVDVQEEYQYLKLHTLDRLDAMDRKLELILSQMGRPTLIEAPKPDAKDCLDQPDAKDCADVQHNIRNCGKPVVNGLFDIKLQGRTVPVFCDFTDDGGNWTVIQRKFGESISFAKSWIEYENGFGDLGTDFWLGNKAIYGLTTWRRCSLRVDIWTWENTHLYAVYDTFRLSGPSDEYRLFIAGYSGTLADINSSMNGSRFTTVDNDNDRVSSYNCAQLVGRGSGFWFKWCWNDINLNSATQSKNRGSLIITKGERVYLKRAIMRIRPYI